MKKAELSIKATALAVISALATFSHAAETTLDSVVIIGSAEAAKTLPGSGAVVDNAQMRTEMITDIQQALKTVPGIYVKDEDGHGLRTNIGIRAATGERSAKITLMEDRVLVAPAPYSDPAAYYTPTALRMDSIEVLKGAPLLRHGPQTTGGVVNFVSTPIPASNGGEAVLAFGSNHSQDMHVNYGGRAGQVSWLLETVQRSSDGFKDIDRSNRNSGFRISDYVAKLGWESASGPKQSALLKLQQSEETSNETYLGLTDADFARDPNRRYGLSSIDQMNNKHTGTSLTYRLDVAANTTMTALLYRNEFARDWFKLGGGSALINAANAGDATSQGILDGTTDTTSPLSYKHNNREYYSQGIDLNFDVKLGAHLLKLGGRVHEDEVDRFQLVDRFHQVNGSLVFQSTVQPGAGDNRVGSSDATALWIQDDWQITDRLNANLSLRHEDVESTEVRYTDPARTVVNKTTVNSSSELLPGASFTFDLTPSWQVLAGVHKGFSPLGAGSPANQEPETSTNWELGGRYRNGSHFVEVIGFSSDFSDKTENCSVGAPCSNGATSGTNVLSEAEVKGVELQAGTRFQLGAFALPLNAAYTYTQAEISADRGTVKAGDRLKDVPEQTASLRAGLEHAAGWNNYLVAKFIDDTCIAAGCNRTNGAFSKTESLLVVDYISRYRLHKDAEVFLKVENLLDEQKIVARTPDGARPNKPLSVALGVALKY